MKATKLIKARIETLNGDLEKFEKQKEETSTRHVKWEMMSLIRHTDNMIEFNKSLLESINGENHQQEGENVSM